MSSSTSDWEPPSPEELQAMLPQYEISEIIGRGGMGAVYKGRQTKLNRTVAIKLLPETFTSGEDELNFAKRFEQEAQAMANLDHPAIISVYDFGETANGQLYFVMEFVDGMDVFQYLQHHGGKLPQESALAITAHVLDALDYAHSHGIAHRDIKPANILLNHEGRVKIADFGLAKKFGDAADKSAPALTLANIAVGTPDFVAPEALDSDQTPDHRADLYAVGVMLYQMLTGKLPRGNYLGPSELDAAIDERLDEIVGKAMATDPDHRYQSAAAVRADLDLVLSHPLARVEAGEPSGAVVAAVPVTTSVKGGKAVKAGSTPPKSKTPLYAGLGVGALAVLGIGAFVLFGGGGKQEATRPSKVESAASEPATVPSLEVRATPATPVKVIEAPKPEPPKPVVAEPPAKPVAPKPDPVAVAPPKAPEPIPTPVAAKPAVPTADSQPPTAPKSGGTRETAPPLPPANPLLTNPGLQTRLDGYLATRRTQLTELATKYGRGLESRLGQAADAGDLKTASAYTDEKARVEALIAALATPPLDPVAAVGAPVALPDLAAGSPETLVTLRQTWTTESMKIRSTLDAALKQSLQALEVELTKARDLEKAKAVVAWRESLGKEGSAGTPARNEPVVTAGTMPTPEKKVEPADKSVRAPLPAATKDVPYENSLGMKFVPVPGTDVLFCIHEVRYKDYEEYAKKAKENVDGGWKTQTADGFEIKRGGEDHPVTNVNWDDAQKFCAWLSEKEGRTYRLPTDQEWSHAVGIGREEDWKDDTTPATVFKVPDVFPWGDEWPPPKGAGNYSDASRQAKAPRDDAKYVEGGYDDGFPTTAPVMSFEANKLGLFDLGGNVWEWCEDWYSVDQKERVLRGGSLSNLAPGMLLSSSRIRNTPDSRNGSYGFRVVVAVSPAPAPVGAAPPVSRPVPPPMAADSALARATKDAPFENSIGMKFVPVPGTDVLFCIHEVRYKDYEEYAKKAKESVEGSWKTQTNDGFEIKKDGENHPVTRVNWDDAQKFCVWLSEKEGVTYRLPTDQEWSRAVGIGREEDWKDDTSPATVFQVPDHFPWGTEWPPPAGAGNFNDESRRAKAPRENTTYELNGYDDGFPTTSPVMSFQPNSLGLWDMGGNVWEWCEDWYPVKPGERVLRGGSWTTSFPKYLLTSHRTSNRPNVRRTDATDNYGFRVVLVVSGN